MTDASSLRFDRFQEYCLYEPGFGFYAEGGRAGGARGDFITSVEVGPLFGAVIARAAQAWWQELGGNRPLQVVEVGAGAGTLAAAILTEAEALGLPIAYRCVERSARLRSLASDRLGVRTWRDATIEVSDAPTGEPVDLVVANELLDNVPVRVLERVAGPDPWAEVWVPDELRPTELALDHVLDPSSVAIGTRLPVAEAAAAWVASTLTWASRVLAFDYGVEHTAELCARPWLRTYGAHRAGSDPYEQPGELDITVDVPFDQLPVADRLTRQADWLTHWGIDDLVAEGRRIWTERAAIGDLAAIRGRSRVTEADALTDRSGLGAFWVAEWVSPLRPA